MPEEPTNINYKVILYMMTFPNFILAFLCYILFRLQDFDIIFNKSAQGFVDKVGGPTIFFIVYLTILTIMAFALRKVFTIIFQKSPNKFEPFVKAIMLQSGFNTISVINLLIIINFGFEWVYMLGFAYAFLLEIILISKDYQLDNTDQIENIKNND